MRGIIPGKVISHYRITEKLGSGGIHIIYKSEVYRLVIAVALKFLPPSLFPGQEAIARFNQEVQSASAPEHNNIRYFIWQIQINRRDVYE